MVRQAVSDESADSVREGDSKPARRMVELSRKLLRSLQVSITHVEPPVWLPDLLAEIAELGQLNENWDSYGARRIDPRCVEAAVNLLHAVLDVATPRPTVVPTSRGGVQLEWHRGGIDLEIEIQSPARMNVFFEDEQEGIRKEMTLTGNIRPLVAFLQCLEAR